MTAIAEAAPARALRIKRALNRLLRRAWRGFKRFLRALWEGFKGLATPIAAVSAFFASLTALGVYEGEERRHKFERMRHSHESYRESPPTNPRPCHVWRRCSSSTTRSFPTCSSTAAS